LPEQTTLFLDGIGVVNMCHHPYSNDNSSGEVYEDKYSKWRPEDDRKVLLCGHVHELWKTKLSTKGSLMINVGVDVHGMKPISIDQILELIKNESQ
jgi:calcineurin-like phosphoesterase family protein